MVIELPTPDGGTQRFSLWQNDVLPQRLLDKYPNIRTYTARGLDDGHAYARLDLTEEGFHAMVLTPDGTWFIDPFGAGNTEDYLSYRRSDFVPAADKLKNEAMPVEWRSEAQLAAREAAQVAALKTAGFPSTGDQLRTYNIAISTTGEYTAFHGGTVPGGLSAVTTTLNRVAGIYTVEFSVGFTLHPNNDTLIFTNAGTDPFTNTDIGLMLDENQTTIDARIGNANYDVGHIFGTEGGGLAYLGCVCSSGIKAQGGTGLGSPIGDTFDVDYVAHELGHQFDANHTWNYCYGGGEPGHAYEPGSASTIMGYAGLCGPDDLQGFSHPQFHVHNFDEVYSFTVTGSGGGCATLTPTGNDAPTPIILTPAANIPISTPLQLHGTATDAAGDSLTYCWEQFNLGPSGPVGTPSGNAPIFRTWQHTPNSTRILPRLDELVNNTAPFGELLPTYGRNITFYLTVRDNLGGVAYRSTSFTAVASAGPFLVSHPNFGGLTFAGGEWETITWDVANTDGAAIGCDSVDIYLSQDGGFTWPMLLSSSENDGSEVITMPEIACTTCRIVIEGHGKAFFDMSNYDFTIDTTLTVVEGPNLALQGMSVYPQPGSDRVQVSCIAKGDVQWQLVNELGQVLQTGSATPQGERALFELSVEPLSSGMYWLKAQSEGQSATRKVSVMH
jgi:hypothetical protein